MHAEETVRMAQLDPIATAIASPTDLQRPRYHVVSPSNWLNDPNGLIQKYGMYHLYYQFNPHNPRSETKHWGHVSSPDLVHWTYHPIALAPVPDSPDADGVYSGCAVDRGEDVLLMYTGVAIDAAGVEHQLPCVATSIDPELIVWERWPGNPVIAAPPAELDLHFYRDHTIWRDGDAWLMGIGSSIVDVGGAVLAYRSTDLIHWEYLHPLVVGRINHDDPLQGGTGWECPDFYRTDADHGVLMISGHTNHPINVVWMTGEYGDARFRPAQRGLVDGGPSFYAPQSFTDEIGRRVMFGWLRERRTVEAQVAAGWSGAMTLPRIVTVSPEGAVETAPAPENDQLRLRELPVAVGADGGTDLTGDTIELIATFAANSTDPVGLRVRAGAAELTEITWEAGALAVDSRQASTDPAAQGARSELPAAVAAEEAITLRVYLDRSVIEVYLNDRVCISERVYPLDPGSQGVAVIGAEALVSLRAWAMGEAFSDA
jgi:beta-fructofuranosidase